MVITTKMIFKQGNFRIDHLTMGCVMKAFLFFPISMLRLKFLSVNEI